MKPRRVPVARLLLAAVTAAAATLAVLAPSALAAPKPLVTGTADPGYTTADPGRRAKLFDETVAAGARVVRINAFWFRIGANPLLATLPAAQSSPANPLYDFDNLDAAVREARSRGLDVILTLHRAPAWAQGDRPGRPPGLTEGIWDPDPAAFGRFAEAVAARYSGTFEPDLGGPALPRVRWYQAWNEPNLRNHLMPQYEGGQPVSIEIYRELLDEGYRGVKRGDGNAKVVAAGTAPLDDQMGSRVAPERFWRGLLCLDASLAPLGSSCARPEFDIFDHHPITLRDPAEPGPDGRVWIADFADLTRILRAAERLGTLDPLGSPRPLWATEIYWETDPPDTRTGLPPAVAAAYLQRGLRMLHERGVSLVLNFFLADATTSNPSDPKWRPAGLLYSNLQRKPSFTAFRFPFVTDRATRRKVVAWGKAPVGGQLLIQRKVKRRWKPVKRIGVNGGAVFKTSLKLKGKATLRAKVGRDKSLVYQQR